MSPNPASPSSPSVPAGWPFFLWLRWGLMVALLAGEVLFLSISFDTAVFEKGEDLWTRIANDSPVFLRIGFAALAAFLVIAYPRLTAIFAEARRAAQDAVWLPWLLLHGLAFAGFFFVTGEIFGAAAERHYPAGGQLAVWGLLGAALLALWLLAAAPFGYWRRLLFRERVAFLAAAVAGAAAWGLGELTRYFWRPLAEGTFVLSKGLLAAIYEDVLYDRVDHTLGTPHFLVSIAPECSGYEGIGLVTVFLAIYLWLFRDRMRFPQALLLFPLGALAIWLANSVRIAALIALGTSYSREVALGGFHSQAGWIAFAVIALGLIALTGRLRLFARPSAEGDVPEAAGKIHEEAEALLVPLLVLMAAVMLTSALSHGFDWLYPLRPIVTAAVLWRYRAVYREWDWTWTWVALAIGAAVFVMWLLLERNTDGSALEAAVGALPEGQRSVWLVFRVLGSVILVPLAEELAFRGYLMRRLVASNFEEVPLGRFTWLSFLGSSLAFGLVHGRWLAGTLAGMAFAGAVYRRGRLADAVVAHMTTNALIAFWVLAFGEWRLWS